MLSLEMEILGIITTIVGAVLIVFSQRTKQTIEAQKTLIDTQKERLDLLVSSDTANTTNIAMLQGQVDVLKTIPLKDISESLKMITNQNRQIAETQKATVELLRPIAESLTAK